MNAIPCSFSRLHVQISLTTIAPFSVPDKYMTNDTHTEEIVRFNFNILLTILRPCRASEFMLVRLSIFFYKLNPLTINDYRVHILIYFGLFIKGIINDKKLKS